VNWDWKRLLGFRQSEVLGLDIGSSAVKIVQLRKDDAGYVVTAAGIVDIAVGTESDENHPEMNRDRDPTSWEPDPALREGVTKTRKIAFGGPEPTARAIRDCLQETCLQTKMAVCSVCGPEIAVRDFKFPLLAPQEIEGAVLLEAAQVCPFNTEHSAVDYQLMSDPALREHSDSGDKTTGFLVAATNAEIMRKTQLAKQAHLNCVLMDVDGLALLNCFNECEGKETGQTAAILNVGSSYTTVAIIGGTPQGGNPDNDLPFIRDIAYAGCDIIKRIAAENDVSTEIVKAKLCGNAAIGQLELHDSLEKACEKLIADVTETLRYYAAQRKSASVKKIFACGGFTLVKNFVPILSRRLPVEAVLWNPFDKIPSDLNQQCEDILADRGPAMAVAAGLAMRSI